MKRFFTLSIISLILCLSKQEAAAQFIGFEAITSTNVGGNKVVQVYAKFDFEEIIILNVFGVQITSEPFIHNDVAFGNGGSWDPSYTVNIPGFSDPLNDSYVTLGLAPLGGSSPVALDPGFMGGMGNSIPPNAGWYNSNPGNPIIPEAVPGLYGSVVLIGQFVLPEWSIFAFSATIGYTSAGAVGVSFGEDMIYLFPGLQSWCV